MIPEHEEHPVVVRDAFPSLVTIAGDTIASARAIVTRSRLYVFTGAGRERNLVLDEAYVPEQSTVPAYNARRSESTHLLLADGRTVTVARQRGCGCGSSLKAWNPWQPYRVASA